MNFEGTWGEVEAKIVSRDNHGQNILDKLEFSCEIAQYGKTLICIFQQFSASIKKTFSLGGRLGTNL